MKINGYKFGNKNNWRRWVWNRIVEKYKKPKKDAVIVYLAGMEDLDRKIAIERGFSPSNMIAVDNSKEVVETLRKKGAIAIHGDLFGVLKGFSGTAVRIDILIADVCCGVNDSVYRFAEYMTDDENANIFDFDMFNGLDENKGRTIRLKDLRLPVVMFNFMRGRDPGIILNSFKDKKIKHRGRMLMETMSDIRSKSKSNNTIISNSGFQHDLQSNNPGAEVIEEWESEWYSPEYRSYKSGNIVMDSVVFNTMCPPVIKKDPVPNEYTKKVAAALAVRTMRMNGKLKPCPVC